MADVSIDDFEAFFTEVWPGSEPFPWQSELVRKVHQERRWPDLVDLPTGAGKTSLVDIAVFLLALDARQPTEQRWMPRRVVLVVDRRVVVDQAEERGARLAHALVSATDGVVRSVADCLRSLSGGGPPLVRTVLRGGIERDETWARRPDIPVIVSSTVDQVGSRLLFRGYGLSSGMRPIHAGLLGNDVLFLLDEVHLARPFAETLAAVGNYRHWHAVDALPLPDRWQVVELTATPTTQSEHRFPAAPLDPGSHPVLARRLRATKPARLEVVKVAADAGKANQQFATRCVELAHELRSDDHVRTLGVIVNRVDTARRVARQLGEFREELDVVLLTGRMRGLDRDKALRQWGERLRIGRERTPDDRPLVVVATQSIEAGADFDLDGVVTECAGVDALRQRFGRVDRDGRLSEAGTPSRSVIAIRSSDVAAASPDPIYGGAIGSTWAWLCGLDTVDFGITALNASIGGADLQPLLPPRDRAPRLLPGHLDQWVQTSLRPSDTEALVGRWLHGIEHDEAVDDVELVWRADLDASLLSSAVFHEYAEDVSARIAACPPVSGESLGVTIREFRRWATGNGVDPSTSDTTGGEAGEEASEVADAPVRNAFLRWSRGRADLIGVRDVRPGDTLVVPSAVGGLSLDNWDPASGAPVRDVALEGARVQRGRAVARLSPALPGAGADVPDPDVLEHESKHERTKMLKRYLEGLAAEADDDRVREVFEHLACQPARALRVRAFAHRVADGALHRSYVVTTTTPLARKGADTDLAPDDGADAVSFTGVRRVTLAAHLHGVGGWAELLAGNLGVAKEVVADLGLAGRLHDLGKADSRFQRWLGGGLDGAASGELLAKSSTPDFDRLARSKARKLSGYPMGARHELLSLAMVQGPSGPVAAAHDPELVVFLVASHHGFGRYRFDPCCDPTPETVRFEAEGTEVGASSDHGLHRLDAGVPDLFWPLVRRYGWFGLAWLEAILRLADHARSRQEQEQETDEDAPAEAVA